MSDLTYKDVADMGVAGAHAEIVRLRAALARIESQEEHHRPWTNPRIIAREALELCCDGRPKEEGK